MGVALGDLDKDGDLDAFLANGTWQVSLVKEIWINDGKGYFSKADINMGESEATGVKLGDIDNDGDLDAFITCAKAMNYG